MITTRDAMDRLSAQASPPDPDPLDTPPFQVPTTVSDESDESGGATVVLHRQRDDGAAGGGRGSRRGPSRSMTMVLAAAVLSVLVVVGATAVLQLRTPTVATPAALSFTPLPHQTPQTLLSGLARKAGAQPPPPGSGRYQYVRSTNYNLQTGQTTSGKLLSSGIELTHRQTWFAPDATGRILQSSPGDPTAFIDDTETRAGAMGYTPVPASGPVPVLVQQLLRAHPHQSAGQWLTFLRETAMQQVMTPTLQQALLTLIAPLPGLTLDGQVTDRTGRPGVAISAVDNTRRPPEKVILVLNPDTGMLLDSEQVALKSGGLPITAPATIGYSIYLTSGYTPNTTTTP